MYNCSKPILLRQETWINLRQRETPNTFTRVQITSSFYNSCWYNTDEITIKWGARKYNNESTCDEAITPTMCHRLLVARAASGATALLMTTQPAFWIERHTNKKAKITSNKNTQIRKITSRDNDHTTGTHINCSSTMRWCVYEEKDQLTKKEINYGRTWTLQSLSKQAQQAAGTEMTSLQVWERVRLKAMSIVCGLAHCNNIQLVWHVPQITALNAWVNVCVVAEIVDTPSLSHLEQVGDPQSESEAGRPRSFAVTNSNGRFTVTAHKWVTYINMTR